MTSQQVDVQVWDGSQYNTVATMVSVDNTSSTTVTFPTVTTQRLRFWQPAAQGPLSYLGVLWITEADYTFDTTTSFCPDGVCNGTETQVSCPADCGAPTNYFGDLNNDGKITISDIMIIMRHILNRETNWESDVDEDGDVNIFDLVKVARIWGKQYETDTTAPTVISSMPSQNILPLGTTTAIVGVETDERAVCKYDANPGTDLSSMTQFTITGGIQHTKEETGLQDDKNYLYYVKCIDESSNTNVADYLINFSVGQVIPEQPSDVDARVEIDIYNENDGFTISVANNDDAEYITSVVLTGPDDETFDDFPEDASFSITPNVNPNNDGVRARTVTIIFTGNGLAPGSTLTPTKNWGDIDWIFPSEMDIEVHFGDGSVLSGTTTTTVDNGDGYPLLVYDSSAGPGPICDNDGSCDSGETNANCPNDCPAEPVCGANGCEVGESCSSCPADCGVCGDHPNEPVGFERVMEHDLMCYPDTDGGCDGSGYWENSGSDWAYKPTTDNPPFLRVHFPEGHEDGNSPGKFYGWDAGALQGTRMNEIYISLRMKIEGTDYEMPPSMQKIFYVAHGNTRITSDSYLILRTPSGQGHEIVDHLYLGWRVKPRNDSTNQQVYQSTNSPYPFRIGQWHNIESYLKASDPDVANGIVKVWLDGNLIIDRSDVQTAALYDDYTQDFFFFQFTPVWGGNCYTPCPKTRDDSWLLDDIYISGRQ
jgi:hypothetical protein